MREISKQSETKQLAVYSHKQESQKMYSISQQACVSP
jgi:hypothetical protein